MVTKHQKGEIILRHGSTEKCLFRILTGSVAISGDRPEEYRVLSAPRCFGELTALTGQPSPVTALAVTEVSLRRVREEELPAFIADEPECAIAIMRSMARALSGLPEESPEVPAAEQAASAPTHAPAKAKEAATPTPSPAAPPAGGEVPVLSSGPFLPGHGSYAHITHPEYKAMVFDKKLTCPHCRKSLTGKRVFQSKLAAAQSPGQARYDLRTFYANFQMEWFDVITCPHCYFSTIGHFFLEPPHLKKDRYADGLAKLKESIWLDFSAERSLEFVIAQHYLALTCAEGFLDSIQLKARFWTNLTWLYEDTGDEEPRRLAEAKAIEASKEVYRQCRLNPVQEQRLCMILAGFLYRAGDLTEAREWAFKARVNKMGKPVYAELAEQLIGEIREGMKNA